MRQVRQRKRRSSARPPTRSLPARRVRPVSRSAYRLDEYLSVNHPDYKWMETKFAVDRYADRAVSKDSDYYDRWFEDLRSLERELTAGGDGAVHRAIEHVGLTALWSNDETEFPEIRRLVRSRVETWYDSARNGPTRREQQTAAAHLRKLGDVLAGHRPGAPRRGASPREVSFYFHQVLFRVVRGRELLTVWPFSRREASGKVAQVCGVPASALVA